MCIEIVVQGNAQLLQIVFALTSSSRLACLLHCGKQQGDQNGDNCDHDQQFDQRESCPLFHAGFPEQQRGFVCDFLVMVELERRVCDYGLRSRTAEPWYNKKAGNLFPELATSPKRRRPVHSLREKALDLSCHTPRTET